MLKDLGGELHPHADVHLVVDELDAQALALVGKPLRAGAAGGGDEPGAVHLVPPVGDETVALLPPVLNGGDGGVEAVFHMLLHGLIDALKDLQVVLGAQVLAAGLEEMEVMLQGALLQRPGLGGGGGKDLGGGAVLDIDGIHIVDEVHDLFPVHEVGEPAAESGGKVILAVGEGARAAKTAHGIADLAVNALLYLARHNGTAAGVDIGALIQGDHLERGMAAHQLVPGEDPGLAAADDGYIVSCVHVRSFPFLKFQESYTYSPNLLL